MTSADLKAGDTLGRYEILMPVAKGGMAAVWAARLVGSRGFQKVVAIKTMLPGMGEDSDFEAMLLDEARLAARIRHPHVVEIIDLGEEGKWLYLVMEWVNGETLFTVNKRARAKGGIPTPLAMRILSGACAGLQAAHELRDDSGALFDLVHRDVSPQNIMVSFSGIVKVVDFGVAKASGRTHETRVGGIMKGKVPYLSPEQLSGKKLDRRADIFALGILAYVMVSGRHPFKGETDLRTMDNICTRAPVPLRDLVPETRIDVEQIIMRALAKEPDERWPDCAEMQRAIDQVLSAMGQSVTDGDVASFMKDIVGDLMEERDRALAEAIAKADARAAGGHSKPAPAKKSPSSAPLAVTSEGILPVALEETEADAEAVRLYASSAPPSSAARSSSIVVPVGRKRRGLSLPAIAVGLVGLVGGGLIALKLGNPPWLASLLGSDGASPSQVLLPTPPPSGTAPPGASAEAPPASVLAPSAGAPPTSPSVASPHGAPSEAAPATKTIAAPPRVAPRPVSAPVAPPVATATAAPIATAAPTAIAAPTSQSTSEPAATAVPTATAPKPKLDPSADPTVGF